MTHRARLGLFAVAGPGLLAVLLIGLHGLPGFGAFHGAYGLLVDSVEPRLRHATDIVTALNFDLRAFDTLGEEMILFGAVTGLALLLRHLREDELERSVERHRFAGQSAALRTMSLLVLPAVVALGVYVVLHGALTPGGGFQGGVVLASGAVIVLLGGRYLAIRQAAPDWMLEAVDSLGAAGFTLLGLAGLVLVGVYLKNFLPFGTSGQLLSGGIMPLNSIAIGVEVTGAFLLTWTEFLDQDVIASRGEL